MKFYVASGLNNKELVRYVAEELKSSGFLQTYDWTRNERASTIDDLVRIGEEEKKAVIDSDFLVLLLPGGKGSHTEFGMALGLGKRIYLYSQDEGIYHFETTTTFYHVKGITKFVGSIEQFVKEVKTQEMP